jgi:MerR family mercuric resistance operon transcriptional regulator
MSSFTIGQLAAAGGVNVETVRFYQRRGLIEVPERAGAGYRRYSERDRDRLQFIRRAKDLGFTLTEIAELLASDDGRTAESVAHAAAAKLDEVDAKLRELMALRCRLRQLLRVCAHGDNEECAALQLLRPA